MSAHGFVRPGQVAADLPPPDACVRCGRPEGEHGEMVSVSRSELDCLLAVATLYVDAFDQEDMMTLPEKMRLQDVEALLEKHGRRY